MSGNNMTVIRALDALDATVHLLAASRGGDVLEDMSDIMAKLSGAVGASRASWCFIAADQEHHIVERYVTGGDPAISPVGASMLTHALRVVPELRRVADHDQGFVIVEAGGASRELASITRGSVDWVAGTASRASSSRMSILLLAGKGQPPDPAQLNSAALSTISEIMRSMVFPLSSAVPDAPSDEFLALVDGLDVGVVLSDDADRVLWVNPRATTWLGTSNADLRGKTVKVTDWNWWLDPVDVLPAEAVGEPTAAANATPVPTIVRLLDSSGRTVRVLVTVREVIANTGAGAGRRVATLQELPVAQELPARGAGVADANRDLGVVVGRLRSVLDDLETYRGAPSVRSGILPEEFAGLTAREREIVGLLLGGVRVTTIAQRLFLSPHTVRNHLRAIFKKVGVPSQAELIELARGIR